MEETHRVQELVYESDFDENGVLFWIGSHRKTAMYQNPHAAGLVEADMRSVQTAI